MAGRDMILRFEIKLPRWSRQRWIATAFALAIVTGGIVYANVNWTPFNQGEKLTSAKLNANLQAMADAISVLQQGGGGLSYCGVTGALSPNQGGYPGASQQCAAVCQNAQTAHVCRADEMVRLASSG